MKVIQKIVSLTALMLFAALTQAQTQQNLQGMTIFDSNSIHIENNSLSTVGILTTVLERQTKNNEVVAKSTKKAANKEQKIAIAFHKAVKAIAKNKSTENIFPSNGGLPSQNSFFAQSNVGICTTTTNYKYNESPESTLIDSTLLLSIDYTNTKTTVATTVSPLGTSLFSYYHSSRPPPFI